MKMPRQGFREEGETSVGGDSTMGNGLYQPPRRGPEPRFQKEKKQVWGRVDLESQAFPEPHLLTRKDHLFSTYNGSTTELRRLYIN